MTEFADAARAAAQALRDLFPPTPLQKNAFLSERHDAEIWLKREDLSPVRSYKIRGAFNAMRKRLSSDPGQAHFVCASAGNHAQGLAFACAAFRRAGHDLHAGHHARAENRQDARLWRRQCRDTAGGRFLRRNARGGQGVLCRCGRPFPAALRRPPRDRGGRPPSPSRWCRNLADRPMFWCCRWAAAAFRRG